MCIEWLKILALGILEGITEWLPVSSTGHLILLGNWLSLEQSPAFCQLFDVVIQLGAILPLAKEALRVPRRLWGLILLALLPSAILGILLDDLIHTYFYSPLTVALMLILWGVIFWVTERLQRGKQPTVLSADEIGTGHALTVGGMQVFSLLAGTSRSGATMIGGMMSGLSRSAAANFSFLVALPTMACATLLKSAKFFWEGNTLDTQELLLLLLGSAAAYFVSALTLGFLRDYVKRHTLIPFGIYRILLGLCVLFYTLR